MNEQITATVDAYKDGSMNRRTFLSRLIAATGSMAAAHLLLESSGLADTVSEKESRQAKVVSQMVAFPTVNAGAVSGYLSRPEGEGRFPAVVVIHENRGLNEHTRDVARRFAAEGFVALAPDLLSRKGGTAIMASPDKAREILSTIPPEHAIADLKDALSYLNNHSRVQPGKLASVGFCWGGARSFTLATESDLLRAAVVFYGSAPPLENLAQVKCPVLGIYGETDERITSQVPAVAEAMQKSGKQFEYKIYEGAGHAFFNDAGERYNAEAAQDAWVQTITFLRKHLA
jgi:carboxymethylenebutenolidase